MRIAGKVSIWALAAIIGHAAAKQDSKQPVTVYTDGIDGSNDVILMRAKGIASQMFAEAGVRLTWRMGQPKPYEVEQAIVIQFTTKTPTTFKPGAFAFAKPFEGVHVRVFYDRIQKNESRLVPILLAHVLVHEITHILQGTDRHSPQGVMKAHWTMRDFMEMSLRPLSFDPCDVELIHLGLAGRERAPTKALLATSAVSAAAAVPKF